MSIQRKKEICAGAPTLGNRRITIMNMLQNVVYSNSLVDVLNEYNISKSDFFNALEYCSNLKCTINLTNIEHNYEYCADCVLDKRDEYNDMDIYINTNDDVIYKKHIVYSGTVREYLEDFKPKRGWNIAKNLLHHFKYTDSLKLDIFELEEENIDALVNRIRQKGSTPPTSPQ